MSPHPLLHCPIDQYFESVILFVSAGQSGNGGEGVETFREKSAFGLQIAFGLQLELHNLVLRIGESIESRPFSE